MSSQTTIKALGLNINPNFLDLPNGTLVQADDVIIRRQNVVESRRGLSDWSEGFGNTSTFSSQLMQYKSRILANKDDHLYFASNELDSNDREIMDLFAGSYSSPGDYRIKFTEANKNLYFTTSDGIKKISATSADEFTTASGYIQDAGAVKAIDFTTTLSISQGQIDGFLPIDSAVAYRVIWGYKDVNDNLILGSPSNRNLVYNYASNAYVMDFNRILYILDIFGSSGSSLITDTNYYSTLSLSLNALGSQIKENTVLLTSKIDNDILFGTDASGPLQLDQVSMDEAGVSTLTFSSGDPTNYISIGDWVTVASLTTSTPNLTLFNGNWQVTNVTSNSIQWIFTVPTGGILSDFAPIAATNVDAGATLNSYNYTQIINSGTDNFPTTLNDLSINTPITAGEIATISNVLSRIVDRLQVELPNVIATSLITNYLVPYTPTESANVFLKISIPTDSQGNQLSSSYFLQVYRSNVFEAFNGTQSDSLQLGLTVIPNDELHLVYEYFPTSTDFSNKYVTFLDNYPDSLAQFNAPLYTNPSTGDGIDQSNDIPPLAQDINLFKNVIFYANTKTRHTVPIFQLIGVDNITSGDKITIANENTTSTYTFVDGSQEITQFTITSVSPSTLKADIQDKYFTINSANNVHEYYVWFRYDGMGTDPLVNGKTSIIVDVITGDTVALVCQRTAETLNDIIFDFTAVYTSNTFTTTNVDAGITTNATVGNISGAVLAISVTQQGNGENASTGQVLISRTLSAGINIQLTSQSLIRVINQTSTSPIYAYYTSGDNTPPGQMTLQAKILADIPFYIIASGTQFNTGTNGIGNSFNPNISPIHVTTGAITNSIISGYVTFNATAHGLQNGYQIIITNTNSVPITDGIYTVFTVTLNTFDILHSSLSSPGTHFSWELTSDSVVSTNSIKPNRLYYSKFNQPDAVPLLNYFEIGREDKAILRIFPLRSSLFVFKEDGLYRISGDVAPFVVQLFDSSCILIAPDTVDVTNNTIFCWTQNGIVNVTESTSNQEMSIPVNILLYQIQTFPSFKTATWGIGYNSDDSYTVFTTNASTDEVATVGYRYSTLTNTWTNVRRSQTCGILKDGEDILYMGSGTDNIINRERKTFTRTDYADRDFKLNIQPRSVNTDGTIITFNSVIDIDIGDVLLQEQTLTIYRYNNLLQQLDLELSLEGNYYTDLAISTGVNLREAIINLAQKLDADPGTNTKTYYAHIQDYTVPILSNNINNPTIVTTSGAHNLVDQRVVTITGSQSIQSIDSINGTFTVSNVGTWGISNTFTIPVNVKTGGTTGLTVSTAPNSTGFADIGACYNTIISLLNNDMGIIFQLFQPIVVNTPLEVVIISINRSAHQITGNIPMQWVIGPIQVYKAIPCEILYAPLTFGDVLMWKQIYEATIMFSNTAFTNSSVSFSSDLKPDFITRPFNNLGNGIFGSYSYPGFGGGYFGGGGNSKPFRTLIPLQTQRCRYINLKWNHRVAREICEMYGITLTGNITNSTRAYR